MQQEANKYSQFLYPPGGILIWIIIIVEIFTFAAAMLAMVVAYRAEPELFHQSKSHLNILYGSINTVFLLSSGFCMAKVVENLKIKNLLACKKYLIWAILGGLLFLGLKSLEYSDKIHAGWTMGVNTFWNFYWMLTLFHVIHVVVGLLILGAILKSFIFHAEQVEMDDVEAGAAFWHMCDLIWLFLFPVLYLIF